LLRLPEKTGRTNVFCITSLVSLLFVCNVTLFRLQSCNWLFDELLFSVVQLSDENRFLPVNREGFGVYLNRLENWQVNHVVQLTP